MPSKRTRSQDQNRDKSTTDQPPTQLVPGVPAASAPVPNRRGELTTYEILIPMSEDGTGVLHEQAVFDRWQDETARRFGGLSFTGFVKGKWFDPKQDCIVPDDSRSYVIGIEPDREPELIDHAVKTAETFVQQCIFLERRGTAFLVYPNRPQHADHGGPMLASESSAPLGYEVRLSAAEARFVERIEQHIADGLDYFRLLELAFGPDSPLLRGAPVATADIQQRPAYVQVRDAITAYGRSLGLLRSVNDTSTLLAAESEMPAYGLGSDRSAPEERFVSQHRAARMLGWTLDEVRAAIASGRLRSRNIDGARVVAEDAVRRF